jgi:hypothetical protein
MKVQAMKFMVMIVLMLLCMSVSVGQEAPAPVISPALSDQLDSLEAYAVRVRGLEALTAVERNFPSREQAIAFLRGQFDDPEIQTYYTDAELVYKAFDLLEPDLNLLETYAALLEDQVGGFYDSETKQMNTILITGGELTDRLPLLEQIVYVHEYVHALQDQYFNLDILMGDVAATAADPDRAQAITALIEGDATQAMTDFITLLTEDDPQAVLSELGAILEMSSTLEIPPGTPKILSDELTFPYLQGQAFVVAITTANGPDAVNQAFLNPPVSTEQIIDPQKYLDGDLPIAVGLASVEMALGAGWIERFDRTAGEFFVRRVLEQYLTRNEVTFAAGGWGGDRYKFYVQEQTGDVAYLWKLTWDSPRDADQFFSAYEKWGAARFAGRPDDSGCWHDEAYALCAVQLGLGGDTLISRAPEIGLARAMITAAR